MLKRLKRRIVASGPGLTVAVIAMLVALTGGAFAASGALNVTQKKEVKKIAQAEAKKFAKAGPAGAAGVAGAKGDKGDQGSGGASGKDGTSLKVSEIPIEEAECEERGGALIEKEGTPGGIEVCTGEEGSPWTAGGTLPVGATETGAWAAGGSSEDVGDLKGVLAPISFAIPLPVERLINADVHMGVGGEGPEGAVFSPTGDCPGESTKPTAAPGKLCIYENANDGLGGFTLAAIRRLNSNAKGSASAGAYLELIPTAPSSVASGSFAVTGCVPDELAEVCAAP
jgi:hypothetical protein